MKMKEMKIKEKLGKIKIRQRFVNLKERIKEPQTQRIILVAVVGSSLFFYPLSGARAMEEATKAVEAAGLENTSLLNKTGNKLKVGVLAVTGLKGCLDPTAPPIRRVIGGAKLVCCGGYVGANAVSSIASFSPQAKVITSACCALSWGALSGLEYIDAKTK
jgi:hypothetical protein